MTWLTSLILGEHHLFRRNDVHSNYLSKPFALFYCLHASLHLSSTSVLWMATRKKKKISKKRQRLGRQLARTLPRDKKGKFLPAGSKNLFRRKPVAKRKRTSGRKSAKRVTKTLRRSSRTMAKRRRIVGGARRVDEFANFLVFQGRLNAAIGGLFGTFRVATPLPRIKTSGKKATVLEILWGEFLIPSLAGNFDHESVSIALAVQCSIGSPPGAILKFNDPRVFMHVQIESNFIKDVNGSTRVVFPQQPFRYELQTRGTGAGYLLTAEAFNFTLAAVNQNQLTAMVVEAKVWYRFVEIPLDEFVGLVQSTQQQ